MQGFLKERKEERKKGENCQEGKGLKKENGQNKQKAGEKKESHFCCSFRKMQKRSLGRVGKKPQS